MKEQIWWILLYVQGGLTDVWKKNILEDLEGELLKYETVEKFLADLKNLEEEIRKQ